MTISFSSAAVLLLESILWPRNTTLEVPNMHLALSARNPIASSLERMMSRHACSSWLDSLTIMLSRGGILQMSS